MSTTQTPSIVDSTISVNALAEPLVARLVAQAGLLRVGVSCTDGGTVLVDGGIDARGGIAAGTLIAEICMGGLGRVSVRADPDSKLWPTAIEVQSSQPVLACLGSQYAGWSLSATKEQTGGKSFFSLGSGPARALGVKETLFEELGYRDRHANGSLVLEAGRMPPQIVIDKILGDCGLAAEQLTLVVTPTQSIAGTVQVVARVLEVALHKAHVVGFALENIVDGVASAPLPPPSPDGAQAMGRTNDAILYGGRVHLTVAGEDDAARELAASLPASNSKDYGRPFAEIFKSFNYDFYQIDPALFAPAEVWVSSLASGRTYHGGRIDAALLNSQWLAQ